jgi:hypothetical protein
MLMKKILLNFILILTITVLKAQQQPADTILPEVVSTAFKTMYTGLSPDEWTKQGEEYIITFARNGKWYETNFSVKGKWISESITLNYNDLPDKVQKAFEASPYKDNEIIKILMNSNPDAKKKGTEAVKTYSIHYLTANDDEQVVSYDQNGSAVTK